MIWLMLLKSGEDEMKRVLLRGLFLTLSIAAVASAAGPPVAPNGIALIDGYRDWQVIAPSYRSDKGHIRVVLGNTTAIRAFREGKRPFPDGTILAKVAWNVEKHPRFPVAELPAAFVQVEFMIKDAGKYKKTGGWGFARFVGESYMPYGKDAGFVQECFGCHKPVADNDFVFTHWAGVPKPVQGSAKPEKPSPPAAY
jgi:hypothetical protein